MQTMDFYQDFADLCSLLNAKNVEYLVVGAYAVAFHGAPRYTGDLDFWVGPDEHNVSRMLEAVRAFGFPTAELSPEYLIRDRKILQMGHTPIQAHLMTSISGVTWDEGWGSRVAGFYGSIPVFFIGLQTLVRNKQSTGRDKDRGDASALLRNRKQPD